MTIIDTTEWLMFISDSQMPHQYKYPWHSDEIIKDKIFYNLTPIRKKIERERLLFDL